VSVQFGDVLPIYAMTILVLLLQLMMFITDPQKKAVFKVELAAIIDWGKMFVTATYSLEEDVMLVVYAYEKIETVKAAIHAGYTPNVNAVARR